MPNPDGSLTEEELAAIFGGDETGKLAVGYRFSAQNGDIYTLSPRKLTRPIRSTSADQSAELIAAGWKREGDNYVKEQGLEFAGSNGQRIPFTPGEYTDALGRTYSLGPTGNILSPPRILPQSGSQGQTQGERIAQLQEEARLHSIESDKQRAADAELERVREENALRRTKIGEAGLMARQAADIRLQAQNAINSLIGVDPVRSSIGQQGGVQRGTTPAQQNISTLQGIVNTPVPSVDENASIPDLQATIDALNRGPQSIPTPTGIGFAQGGTIDFAGGMDRPQYGGIQLGTSKRAVRLGEGTGTGEEIGIIDPSMGGGITEVIPLMGGAQEGIVPTADSIRQALSRVYGSLGFSNLPTRQGDAAGAYHLTEGLNAARRLGYSPRLVGDVASGKVYYKNEQGQLQHIPNPESFNQAGFHWSDILNLAPGEISQLGPIGAQFSGVPAIEGRSRPFSTMAQPLIEPATGLALPDPAQIAAIWRFLDPETKRVLTSAYGTSGLNEASIASRTAFATPVGSATRFAGARFG